MSAIIEKEYIWVNKGYGQERFEEWFSINFTQPDRFGMQTFHIYSHELYPLLDHCFIVDSAPVWSKGKLDGHELAIISRTYCTDEQIDNPPKGLKTWRLPKDVMGEKDKGTAIAIMIIDDTPEANQVLKSFLSVKTSILPHVLSSKMFAKGYYIGVFSSPTEFNTKLKIMAPQKITDI